MLVLVVVAGYRSMHLANADALLPALMSTEELTWFYWGQDRLANLVPLIASPVRDIRWNIATQLGLIGLGWFTLIAFVAVNHSSAGQRSANPMKVAVATAISGAISMRLLTAGKLQVFVFEQLYAFALVLYIVGLLGVTRSAWRWRISGAVLMVAASMVNPSMLLFAPLAVALPEVRPRSRETAAAGVTAVLAFALTNVAAAEFGDAQGRGQGYDDFSPIRSFDNLDVVLSGIWTSVNGWMTLGVLSVATAVLVARWGTLTPRLRWTYCAAPVFAFGWVVLFSGNQWVASNAHNSRYFFPVFASGVMLITAATTEVVEAAWNRLAGRSSGERSGRHRPLAAAVAIVAPICAAIALRAVEIDVLEKSQPAVDAARQFDADLIAGDYWTVWPAVIEARAQRLEVLGLAYRANAWVDEIGARIEHELANDGFVTVVCLGVDEAACGDSLLNWGLRLTRVVSPSPLVVELGHPT